APRGGRFFLGAMASPTRRSPRGEGRERGGWALSVSPVGPSRISRHAAHGSWLDHRRIGASRAAPHPTLSLALRVGDEEMARYSTVTDFARLRGWSTSAPFWTAT